MSKKRWRRRHRGGGGTSDAPEGGDGARAEAPRPARRAYTAVPPRVVPATKAPAPPPQTSEGREEGRERELDIVESTNGEPNGDAKLPAGSPSSPAVVAEKIAFGGGEIVIYRRVEKKSCSRYMLKDMFD